MNNFAVDMHIHTLLSPCASREMTPRAIVRSAVAAELDLIAICDHNAAGNARAVQEAAKNEVAVLAGIEITTAEEAHVLGLFPDAQAAMSAAEAVGRTLPLNTAPRAFMGEQTLMDAEDRVVGREKRMLVAAGGYTLADAVALIRFFGGLAVAAHIDRPSFSVISQLGMIPKDIVFDAMEISAAGVAAGRMAEFADSGCPLITSSDSHGLPEIGSCVAFLRAEAPNFEELALALRGADGRRCFIA